MDREEKQEGHKWSHVFQLQQKGSLFIQVSGTAKKLVSVLVTSTLMTGAREEVLEYVLYIHYPVQFKDTDKAPM